MESAKQGAVGSRSYCSSGIGIAAENTAGGGELSALLEEYAK